MYASISLFVRTLIENAFYYLINYLLNGLLISDEVLFPD